MLMRIETGSRGMAKVGERESEKWGQMDQQNWTKGKERERTQEWKGGYVYIDNSIAKNRSMAIPMAYNIAIVESYYEQ